MMRNLLFLLLFFASSALADMVPPALPCPDGTLSGANHGGNFCAPVYCTSDSECKDGKLCLEQSMCVETRTYANSRYPMAEPTTIINADMACISGKCRSNATCKTEKYCLTPPKKPATKRVEPSTKKTEEKPTDTTLQPKKNAKAIGCATSPTEGAGSLWMLALLALLLRRKQPHTVARG